jgi:hypothetical protein
MINLPDFCPVLHVKFPYSIGLAWSCGTYSATAFGEMQQPTNLRKCMKIDVAQMWL